MINLNLFKNVPSNIYIKIADTKEELEQAYNLIYQEYIKLGYIDEHISELRVTFYNILPQCSTVIAKVDDKVVGTLTVVNNDSLVLPLERELDRTDYSNQNHNTAQVLDYIILDEYKNSNINFLLMKYCYEYCKDYLNIENIQIATRSKHSSFFQDILGFKTLGQTFYDSSLNGNVFHALNLKLQDFYDFLAINYGKKEQVRNLFFYFTKFDFSQFFEFPERKFFTAHDPVLTPNLLDYFFNLKTSLLSQLSPEQHEYVQYLYDSPEYKEVIPQSKYNITYLNLRRGKRFPVNCKGQLASEKGSFEININNVSPNGFSAIFQKEQMLVINDIFDVSILIGEFNVSNVKAKVVWKKSHLEYGFCLIKSSTNWNEFLDYLNERLLNQEKEEYLAEVKKIA